MESALFGGGSAVLRVLAQDRPGSDQSLSWLGTLVWFAVCGVAIARWASAREAYGRLYDERVAGGPTEPSLTDLAGGRTSLGESLRRGIRSAQLGDQPHDDPEVEAARQRSNRRERQALIVGVGGMLIPLLFTRLGI